MAMQIGAILSLVICFVLLLLAFRAPFRHYKSTETWLILPKPDRPPPAVAQQVIGTALQEAYFWFAKFAASIAFLMFGTSIFIRLLGWASS
ncbi:MAG: hypothetical protein KJ622_15855 [Alphaproteobacteria bacterium]|nr:hypothetical protein [Alphaproteobacteria bacterium]